MTSATLISRWMFDRESEDAAHCKDVARKESVSIHAKGKDFSNKFRSIAISKTT
jgi:hypothetical protein